MVSNLTPSFTPPKADSRGVAKKLLETPVGSEDPTYTMRQHLQIMASPLSRDRLKPDAAQAHETLSRIEVGAPTNTGTINSAVESLKRIAEGARADAERFAPDVVSAKHIENGGKGHAESNDTYAEHVWTARAIQGIVNQLNTATLSQSQGQGAPGRF